MLWNPDYLEELKARKNAQEKYTKRSYEESFKRTYNQYSNGGGSSYYTASQSNYGDEKRKCFMKFIVWPQRNSIQMLVVMMAAR